MSTCNEHPGQGAHSCTICVNAAENDGRQRGFLAGESIERQRVLEILRELRGENPGNYSISKLFAEAIKLIESGERVR